MFDVQIWIGNMSFSIFLPSWIEWNQLFGCTMLSFVIVDLWINYVSLKHIAQPDKTRRSKTLTMGHRLSKVAQVRELLGWIPSESTCFHKLFIFLNRIFAIISADCVVNSLRIRTNSIPFDENSNWFKLKTVAYTWKHNKTDDKRKLQSIWYFLEQTFA